METKELREAVRAVAKNQTGRNWLTRISAIPYCLIGYFWPNERLYCGGGLENNHLNGITSGPRDDIKAIRICFNHHQAQSPRPLGEAYHKGKKIFWRKYGSDSELLELQKQLLEKYETDPFA